MLHPLAACVAFLAVGLWASSNGGTGAVPRDDGARPVTGFLNRSLKSGGKEFKYVVYVPRGYGAKPDEKWPLILFLHGAGECGTDGTKQVAQGLGNAILWDVDAWPFIVVFPQKPEQGRQWEDYDGPVMAMLEDVRGQYAVDGDRQYLTGLSQGGHGTWTFAANHPGTWAAIAPVCGYLNRVSAPPELDASYAKFAEKIKHLPVWAFHGEDDKVVKVEATKAVVDSLKAAGADVRASYYPGVGHDSWTNAYREKLGEWFLRHTRKP